MKGVIGIFLPNILFPEVFYLQQYSRCVQIRKVLLHLYAHILYKIFIFLFLFNKVSRNFRVFLRDGYTAKA
jgi:hypothetical protein